MAFLADNFSLDELKLFLRGLTVLENMQEGEYVPSDDFGAKVLFAGETKFYYQPRFQAHCPWCCFIKNKELFVLCFGILPSFQQLMGLATDTLLPTKTDEGWTTYHEYWQEAYEMNVYLKNNGYLNNIERATFVCHSAGGVYGGLCAAIIPQSIPVRYYSFGSPRIATYQIQWRFENRRAVSIINPCDIVPTLPPNAVCYEMDKWKDPTAKLFNLAVSWDSQLYVSIGKMYRCDPAQGIYKQGGVDPPFKPLNGVFLALAPSALGVSDVSMWLDNHYVAPYKAACLRSLCLAIKQKNNPNASLPPTEPPLIINQTKPIVDYSSSLDDLVELAQSIGIENPTDADINDMAEIMALSPIFQPSPYINPILGSVANSVVDTQVSLPVPNFIASPSYVPSLEYLLTRKGVPNMYIPKADLPVVIKLTKDDYQVYYQSNSVAHFSNRYRAERCCSDVKRLLVWLGKADEINGTDFGTAITDSIQNGQASDTAWSPPLQEV